MHTPLGLEVGLSGEEAGAAGSGREAFVRVIQASAVQREAQRALLHTQPPRNRLDSDSMEGGRNSRKVHSRHYSVSDRFGATMGVYGTLRPCLR